MDYMDGGLYYNNHGQLNFFCNGKAHRFLWICFLKLQVPPRAAVVKIPDSYIQWISPIQRTPTHCANYKPDIGCLIWASSNRQTMNN